LLFVAEPYPAGLYQSSQEGHDELAWWGKEYLAGVVKRLANEGVTAKPIMLDGNPAEMILQYSSENCVDLIIMSTHGRSGPSRWAFGSITDKVVRSSNAPVLVVAPEGCRVQINGV
jgi:nucleotide-binding universal stress UspA family protein